MVRIPLGNKRKYAVIDDKDFKKVARYRWHESVCFAAQRRPRDKQGKKQLVYMHQQILGIVGKKKRVVHKNGNRLDNRRENLQIMGA